jgi:hypothetical protein
MPPDPILLSLKMKMYLKVKYFEGNNESYLHIDSGTHNPRNL